VKEKAMTKINGFSCLRALAMGFALQ